MFMLLEEILADADGVGPVFQLGEQRGKLLILTLGVTHITELDSVLISIWGSLDGKAWGLTPLVSLPPKYYCGLYSASLNLASSPDLRYLRVHWHVRRSKGYAKHDPACGFYVSVAASGSRVSAVA